MESNRINNELMNDNEELRTALEFLKNQLKSSTSNENNLLHQSVQILKTENHSIVEQNKQLNSIIELKNKEIDLMRQKLEH